ncbi:MAG: hypothetical protein KDA05_08680 [Phycisphaerales bacterium]|nr:hypothetical protein [Phycisphaerales bacterium]
MKRRLLCVAAVAAAAGIASAHTTYLDPFGASSDVDPFFLNQGFHHLDIVAAEVENESGAFNFDIVVDADIAATNWGKFLIFLDTVPGGRTDNPWGRAITSGAEADFYIGGWADGGGGAELYRATPTGWEFVSNASPGNAAGLHVRLTNASAGVYHVGVGDHAIGNPAVGSHIYLDVATTGGTGGDPGVDHLSLGSIATPNWQTGSMSGDFLEYEVEPAPGSIAVLGIAGLMAGRRRRA